MHPGLTFFGAVLKRNPPRNPRKCSVPSDEATRATAGTLGNRSHVIVDAMIDAFLRTVRGSSPAQLLLEWIRSAAAGDAP